MPVVSRSLVFHCSPAAKAGNDEKMAEYTSAAEAFALGVDGGEIDVGHGWPSQILKKMFKKSWIFLNPRLNILKK